LPLAAWAALLGLCKPVYLPLVGLAACLPAGRFASRRERLGALGLLGLSALPLVFWALALSGYSFAPMREGADPSAQLAHLLERPQDFPNAVLLSLRQAGWAWGLDPRDETARGAWRAGLAATGSVIQDGMDSGELLEGDAELLAATVNAVLQVQLAGLLEQADEPDADELSERILVPLRRMLCGSAPSERAVA